MKNNWPVKKLGEVVELINGRAFKSSEWRLSGIPIIRIQNLNNSDAPFNYFQGKYSDSNYIKQNDLLFSWSGSIGTSFGAHIWNGPDSLLNQHIFKVVIDTSIVDQSYLYFFLNKIIKDIERKAHGGAGLVHITKSELEKMPILLPVLTEQKKIVERVDAIRKAQELCDQQIQKTEELFESILHNEVKSTGKEVLFTEATDFQEGPGILAKDFRSSGIPLVRLKGTTGPEVTLEGCNFLDPFMVKQKWHHFILKRNDLLLTTSASLGQVSEVTNATEGAITYTGIIRFRPKRNLLNKDYLKYFLSSELFKSQAKSAATGGVIKHFGPIHIKKMKIFLPSILGQQKIVEKLEAVQNYKKLLQKEKALLKELFDSVLDKSMKGELDN